MGAEDRQEVWVNEICGLGEGETDETLKPLGSDGVEQVGGITSYNSLLTLLLGISLRWVVKLLLSGGVFNSCKPFLEMYGT